MPNDFVQITFPYHRLDGDTYILYIHDTFCTRDAPHRVLKLPKIAIHPINAVEEGHLQCLIPYHIARRNHLEMFCESWSA